uniref:Uncharacterized protein n=1 Tax=Daphnia galeata TaxID=27404 RepID=A0A8J2RMP0_9CRUS|nr:unnamed protein product [Daphnia galeata]
MADDSFIVEAPSFVGSVPDREIGFSKLKKTVQSMVPPPPTEKKEDVRVLSEEGSSNSEKIEKDEVISTIQEYVQGDLLRVQKRKVHKGTKITDPSLSVNALTKGFEVTRSPKNDPYRLPWRSCDRCSFKSESSLMMAHHWSLPLALGSGSSARYGCHWCSFEAKMNRIWYRRTSRQITERLQGSTPQPKVRDYRQQASNQSSPYLNPSSYGDCQVFSNCCKDMDLRCRSLPSNVSKNQSAGASAIDKLKKASNTTTPLVYTARLSKYEWTDNSKLNYIPRPNKTKTNQQPSISHYSFAAYEHNRVY